MKSLMSLCFLTISFLALAGDPLSEMLTNTGGEEQKSAGLNVQEELAKFLTGGREGFNPTMTNIHDIELDGLYTETRVRKMVRQTIYAEFFMGDMDGETTATVQQSLLKTLTAISLKFTEMPSSVQETSFTLTLTERFLADMEQALMGVHPEAFKVSGDAKIIVTTITYLLINSSILLDSPEALGKENILALQAKETLVRLGNVQGLLLAKLAQNPKDIDLTYLRDQVMDLKDHLFGKNNLQKKAPKLLEAYERTLAGRISTALAERDAILILKYAKGDSDENKAQLKEKNQVIAASLKGFEAEMMRQVQSTSAYHQLSVMSYDLYRSIRGQLETARASR